VCVVEAHFFCFGRMCGVLHTVQSCGDYDRLVQGVYENFLNMSFRDSRLEAVRYVNLPTLHLACSMVGL
jgi:hypothetical protein